MLKRLIAALVCTIGGFAATAVAEQTSLNATQVRAALRAAHPPAHANFSGKSLHNLALDGLDFSGVNFSNADLLETSFRSATLTGANFAAANLSDVKFDNARMQGANLAATTLLTGAPNADMRNVNLSRAQGYLIAAGANLTGANLSQAKLSPDMSNQPMGLLHTILSEANLTGANLSGANLTSANCENAKFVNANAQNAKFVESDLGNANFTGANLAGADFSRADVAGARFIGIHGRASIRGLQSAQHVDQAVFKT